MESSSISATSLLLPSVLHFMGESMSGVLMNTITFKWEFMHYMNKSIDDMGYVAIMMEIRRTIPLQLHPLLRTCRELTSSWLATTKVWLPPWGSAGNASSPVR